jgi:hypothetical protein
MPAKRPMSLHNPTRKSLQRWDADGGAPKGGRAKRPPDSAQLTTPTSDLKPESVLKRLYAELAAAANKTNDILRRSGVTSEKFLAADRDIGKILRRIKQMRGTPDRRPTSKATARKASQLAAREIEGLGDKSQPVEEQQRRKRRLIHGPREFRDMRDDQPKQKS